MEVETEINARLQSGSLNPQTDTGVSSSTGAGIELHPDALIELTAHAEKMLKWLEWRPSRANTHDILQSSPLQHHGMMVVGREIVYYQAQKSTAGVKIELIEKQPLNESSPFKQLVELSNIQEVVANSRAYVEASSMILDPEIIANNPMPVMNPELLYKILGELPEADVAFLLSQNAGQLPDAFHHLTIGNFIQQLEFLLNTRQIRKGIQEGSQELTLGYLQELTEILLNTVHNTMASVSAFHLLRRHDTMLSERSGYQAKSASHDTFLKTVSALADSVDLCLAAITDKDIAKLIPQNFESLLAKITEVYPENSLDVSIEPLGSLGNTINEQVRFPVLNILQNLISNAVKYSLSDVAKQLTGITQNIPVRVKIAVDAEHNLVITVEDTGLPFPDDLLENLAAKVNPAKPYLGIPSTGHGLLSATMSIESLDGTYRIEQVLHEQETAQQLRSIPTSEQRQHSSEIASKRIVVVLPLSSVFEPK